MLVQRRVRDSADRRDRRAGRTADRAAGRRTGQKRKKCERGTTRGGEILLGRRSPVGPQTSSWCDIFCVLQQEDRNLNLCAVAVARVEETRARPRAVSDDNLILSAQQKFQKKKNHINRAVRRRRTERGPGGFIWNPAGKRKLQLGTDKR